MQVILEYPFNSTEPLGKIIIEWIHLQHQERNPEKLNPIVHAERITIKDDTTINSK